MACSEREQNWLSGLGMRLLLLLFGIDIATKILLATPSWAEDYKKMGLPALATLILVCFLLHSPMMRIPATLAIAGGLGNLLSRAVWGYVPNPLVIQYHHYVIGTNAADVLILTSIAWIIVILFKACGSQLRVLYSERE